MLVSSASLAKPYKVKVFSESAAEERAIEYIHNMQNMEPFRQLIEKKAMVIENVPTIVTGINCRGGHLGIPRLAKCDLESIEASCGDAELCPVYTSVPNIGAGGQRFPIVSSSFPWTTMLHEVVHTFGFTDEYAYTKSESKIYCPEVANWQNGHSSNEEIFESRKAAEEACVRKISWCGLAIRNGSQVVQKVEEGKYKIGTPAPKACPDVSLGVYSGGSCQAKNPNSTYRPYFCPTVMGYPSLGEEFCGVTKRHKIIRSSPNLLPEHYQKIIFEKITRDLKYESRLKPDLKPHTYGIPEIDRLSGQSGQINLCQENEFMNENGSNDWPHTLGK